MHKCQTSPATPAPQTSTTLARVAELEIAIRIGDYNNEPVFRDALQELCDDARADDWDPTRFEASVALFRSLHLESNVH